MQWKRQYWSKTKLETIKNLLAEELQKSKDSNKILKIYTVQIFQEKLSKVESDLADSFQFQGTETVVSLYIQFLLKFRFFPFFDFFLF